MEGWKTGHCFVYLRRPFSFLASQNSSTVLAAKRDYSRKRNTSTALNNIPDVNMNLSPTYPLGTEKSIRSQITEKTGRYKVLNRIGGGSSIRGASVFEVSDRYQNPYAAKIGKKGDNDLRLEFSFLQRFWARRNANVTPPQFAEGCRYKEYDMQKQWVRREVAAVTPQVFEMGKYKNYDMLVMQLLGENMRQVSDRLQRTFSNKTLIMITIRILRSLEHMHNCGYVHCNLKPENVVLGRGTSENNIYIIDYVDAQRWIATKHEYRNRGSTTFSSMNAHRNLSTSRNDDIESLMYCMTYLRCQYLPWDEVTCVPTVLWMKETITADNLMGELPKAFGKIWNDLKVKKYAERPSYEIYVGWLNEDLDKAGQVDDAVFDWTRGPERDSSHY